MLSLSILMVKLESNRSNSVWHYFTIFETNVKQLYYIEVIITRLMHMQLY